MAWHMYNYMYDTYVCIDVYYTGVYIYDTNQRSRRLCAISVVAAITVLMDCTVESFSRNFTS